MNPTHIKNVVSNSSRLKNNRKIACITYTNIGVETILERLGTQNNRVEVSTIHSFLYKHLIKPFAFLIPSKYELDISKIDGHDDIPIFKGMLFEWKKNTKQIYITDDNKIVDALNDLLWQFDSNGTLVLKTKKPYIGKISKYSIRNNSYM